MADHTATPPTCDLRWATWEMELQRSPIHPIPTSQESDITPPWATMGHQHPMWSRHNWDDLGCQQQFHCCGEVCEAQILHCRLPGLPWENEVYPSKPSFYRGKQKLFCMASSPHNRQHIVPASCASLRKRCGGTSSDGGAAGAGAAWS